MALSRFFIDCCMWCWDNLPKGYFHTVLCNAKEFANTTANHDLHFISWDNPPKQHPHYLNLEDMELMANINAPFARKIRKDDLVLDKIDADLLFRGAGRLVPGEWCVGRRDNGRDPCLVIGDSSILRPGPGAFRLQKLMEKLLSKENFRPR